MRGRLTYLRDIRCDIHRQHLQVFAYGSEWKEVNVAAMPHYMTMPSWFSSSIRTAAAVKPCWISCRQIRWIDPLNPTTCTTLRVSQMAAMFSARSILIDSQLIVRRYVFSPNRSMKSCASDSQSHSSSTRRE